MKFAFFFCLLFEVLSSHAIENQSTPFSLEEYSQRIATAGEGLISTLPPHKLLEMALAQVKRANETAKTAQEAAKTANETAKTAQEAAKTANETAKMAQEEALRAHQDRFLKQCAEDHRYNQRFFESHYMGQEYIDSKPNYAKLRDRHIEEHKFAEYRKKNAKVPRFGDKCFNDLTADEQEEVRKDFLKDKRLPQMGKWYVFLHWLLNHTDEWKNDHTANGRLSLFYDELIKAMEEGLSIETFLDCILLSWERACTIEKLPSTYDLTPLFTKFIRVSNPDYIATRCGSLLKNAIYHYPLSPSQIKTMEKWVNEENLKLEIPQHWIERYGSPPPINLSVYNTMNPMDYGVRKTTKL